MLSTLRTRVWWKLIILLGIQVILITQAEASGEANNVGGDARLTKRAFPFAAGSIGAGKGSSSDSHPAKGPPKDPSESLPSECKLKPLTPQTWATLQLDNHLQTFPGGHNITLSQYAASLGVPNFECGIGNACNAGQPCYPVPLPDWYILFAVQQWNIKMNTMRSAIAYAMNFVKSTMATLFAALVPAIDTSQIDRMKLNLGVNGAMAMCSNTVLLDVFSLFHNFQDATGDVFNIVNNIMSAAMLFAGGLIPSPDPPEGYQHEGFNMWAHLEKQMTEYEEHLTTKLSNATSIVENSGISTNEGIYGQIKNGDYIKPVESIFLPIVEDDIKNVTIAISLVKIFRTLDAFVTIGQDVCNKNGKDGAFDGDNVLSYCDRQGTMFNIIRVKEKKESMEFSNAWAIENRFGYSTQLLTNASWTCQQKYGGFEPFPYKNLTLPRDVLSDCIINLPVCDCRDSKIKKHIRKHGVVSACRKAGLPI
ncbi:hypothetical protein MJO28_001175 [Puccinia striiformis f. sp. tritici]|uniref:Uncharacterized protein n=1 Tax=Puccinia striiformis f. sp. tritici TaxID=168172 RepID=A0ACC0F0Z4_9BASI|nr:uncharacterized protein Pst134EA_031555 [Puccinia striiformis f. sp. tritici]KAH9445232.1 hypothetical protein Pst134EA_031555 [Puccinia striiformis f. sp. tritici]KAH9466197.1 hypothetical protein Pst134EB_001257 [Puccinia striiformis f. sp. tritici]KAI7963081.1 hypothetical protein MJO28_001175 [Puccinia striiformis f. sp. tritici]KAI9601671.1 hypothetical protein H4Q26_001504 [Puccinia striiformis f. sp. tritici PST-130]